MFNRSVNKVVLVGNIGQDPEMRYMPNGNAVCNFSLATTESWKNKQSGEYENQTEWHNCAVFGKFAELCGEHLAKGAKIYIEGKIKNEKWNDKTSGVEKSAVKITVSELQLLDPRSDGAQKPSPQQAPQQKAPQMAPAYQPAPQKLNETDAGWVNAIRANPSLIDQIESAEYKAHIKSLL